MFVSEMPCPPTSLLNSTVPLPTVPMNHRNSCALDSLLLALWALWRRGALQSGNSGALFKQVYDLVATQMTSGLRSQEDVGFQRDQLWTVMERAGLTEKPGSVGDVCEIFKFMMRKFGGVAVRLNFETTYEVVLQCEGCGYGSTTSDSESYFKADVGDLPTGVDRFEATLAGVAPVQRCQQCHKKKFIMFRRDHKNRRVLSFVDLNILLQNFGDEWPHSKELYGVKYKLTALIVNTRQHYITLFKEHRLQWVVYDDLFGCVRNTWQNILHLFHRDTEAPLVEHVVVCCAFYTSHQ